MRVRKLPVEVDAMRFDGSHESALAVAAWVGDKACKQYGGALVIETLEGPMRVSPHDVVIRGVKGEFYPVKPDIFDATYEVLDV